MKPTDQSNETTSGAASDAEAALLQRSRAWFDERVADLDARTQSRLNQARHAAVDAARGQSYPAIRWLLPVGSAAVLALAVLGVQHLRDANKPVTPTTTLASDEVEILAADDLELLQNIDFYAWLDEADAGNAHASTSEAG